MDSEALHNLEYLKSRFRCPICGTLAGCSEDGRIGFYSATVFAEHVSECRRGKTEYKTRHYDR